VAWVLPELEDGVEPELKPLELELDEFELFELFELLELEFELELFELLELELFELELELFELEPVEVEPVEEEEEEDVVWCVDPGRPSVTMPAAATLAMVTVVVADLTRARPRSRSAMARRTRSRFALLMYPILRSCPPNALHELSRLAMRPAACPFPSRPEGTHAT
jgi:hypothetical protein